MKGTHQQREMVGFNFGSGTQWFDGWSRWVEIADAKMMRMVEETVTATTKMPETKAARWC